mgnify:CR=1 FL=1
MEWVYIILTGALAGWIAGKLMKGSGYGFIGNVILGIVGGLLGNWIFGQIGFSFGAGWIASVGTAVVGAGVLLFIAGLFKK